MINWKAPLELLDGIPVKLGYSARQPDEDGDYWIIREDGKEITSTINPECRYLWMCVHPNGCEEMTETIVVRNRPPVQVDVLAVAMIIDPVAFSDRAAEYERNNPHTLWPIRREKAIDRARKIIDHLNARNG